jgi:hypothetical protein
LQGFTYFDRAELKFWPVAERLMGAKRKAIMADPHNDYLERAENYERLAEEAQDPVLSAAFRRLARNCRLTAERVSELEESFR